MDKGMRRSEDWLTEEFWLNACMRKISVVMGEQGVVLLLGFLFAFYDLIPLECTKTGSQQ